MVLGITIGHEVHAAYLPPAEARKVCDDIDKTIKWAEADRP